MLRAHVAFPSLLAETSSVVTHARPFSTKPRLALWRQSRSIRACAVAPCGPRSAHAAVVMDMLGRLDSPPDLCGWYVNDDGGIGEPSSGELSLSVAPRAPDTPSVAVFIHEGQPLCLSGSHSSSSARLLGAGVSLPPTPGLANAVRE
jgi:hypothetical protein